MPDLINVDLKRAVRLFASHTLAPNPRGQARGPRRTAAAGYPAPDSHADGRGGKVVAQVDQCRLQRPGHPEDRRDGVERFALADPLGQLGELMGTQPGGTLHGDGSFP